MALEIFTPPLAPSPGTGISQKIKLQQAEFGDGLTPIKRDGINHIRRSLTLTWDILIPYQASYITKFLRHHGGDNPFWYTPSDEYAAIKWTCGEWSDRRTEGGYRQITATFEESFDNRLSTDLPVFIPPGATVGTSTSTVVATAASQAIAEAAGSASGSGKATTLAVRVGIDFITNEFSISGAPTTFAAMVDYISSTITYDTNGARIDWNGTDYTCSNLTTAALSALPTAGLTVVVEWIEHPDGIYLGTTYPYNDPFDEYVPLSLTGTIPASQTISIDPFQTPYT